MTTEIERLYERTNYGRYAVRMHECGRLLQYGVQVQDDGFYKLKLDKARLCRARHCAVCQWRRMLMWRARFFNAIPKVINDYPTCRWIFLTLTVKNCPIDELRATITQMNRAWQRLTQRKRFPAQGWVKSVEVTRSKDDTAHPHFHCLLMVPPSYFKKDYIKHEEWTELWKDVLRIDYTPIVNVKVIKDRQGVPSLTPDAQHSGMIAAILETIKYTVKPEDLAGLADPDRVEGNARWLDSLTGQLHNVRAVAVGGVLKRYINQDDPEDLIHAEDEELTLTEEGIKLWFGWREMVKRYVKESRSW